MNYYHIHMHLRDKISPPPEVLVATDIQSVFEYLSQHAHKYVDLEGKLNRIVIQLHDIPLTMVDK